MKRSPQGKPQEIKRCDKCQDHHAGRPALRLGWPGERKSIRATSSTKNVVTQNLLVSTSRKEISWCNKARLRGASTSRARAKVWDQLPEAGPGACRGWRRGGSQLKRLPQRAWREAGTGYPPAPSPLLKPSNTPPKVLEGSLPCALLPSQRYRQQGSQVSLLQLRHWSATESTLEP